MVSIVNYSNYKTPINYNMNSSDIKFGNTDEKEATVIVFNDKQKINKIKKLLNKLKKDKIELSENNLVRKIRLIIDEKLEGIRKQKSRTAFQLNLKSKISNFKYSNNKFNSKIQMGLFIANKLDYINKLSLSCYIESDSKKAKRYNFNFEILRKSIKLFERPSYWFDFEIKIPQEILDDKNVNQITLVIEDISYDLTRTFNERYHYVSLKNDIKSPDNNKKSVLVLSLDGVSSEIFNNLNFKILNEFSNFNFDWNI